MRHLQKMILGTANNFNLGTKTRYLQYTVNAKSANKRERKEKNKEKREKKSQTPVYRPKLKIIQHTSGTLVIQRLPAFLVINF